MGILDRLFKRGGGASVADSPEETRECLHVALAPGWENPDDMGVEDKANYFTCTTCGQRFTPTEAAELRQSQSDRMQSE